MTTAATSARAVHAKASRAGWRAARPIPFWLDTGDRPEATTAITRTTTCDLLVVGAGFTGLWTAVQAKLRDPDRDVLLLDSGRVADAATGRNGGFCAASLTHGEANGRTRFPQEFDQLDRLGMENLDGIEAFVAEHGIDCDFHRSGELSVATEPHQIDELRHASGDFLDQAAVRAELNSPTYLAGSWNGRRTAMLDPARLAWGLARFAQESGVRIAENSTVTGLSSSIDGMVEAGVGTTVVRARQVALATNAFPSLLRRLRLHTVPVYDYVLVTEPLSAGQLASIGWQNRQGVGDSANQFHYYRLTADHRILWGGYDAIYHFGRRLEPGYDQRPDTFDLLESQFFETFPQLDGLGFSHRWGGAIDTCTRFCAFFGTAMRGRVSYALGYTGLGVGASRFGADVMLDLLAGAPTERTELELVRRRPLPFPPEPLAWAGIELTRRALAAADAHDGRRNLWLRTLDRAGLGFDS